MRTDKESEKHIAAAILSRKRVKGFYTASCLLNLNYFDIIDSFVSVYMHFILLGLANQFLEYWLTEGKYILESLDDSVENIVNSAIEKIKAPIQVARRSRPFIHKSDLKAKEWENWVLLYSIPVLQLVLKKKYLVHWVKLVESLHILLSEEITIELLNKADLLVYEFSIETQQLYGKRAMTYNLHQCFHLGLSVRNLGPVWSHMGFAFESGNGELLNKIHAAKGVLSQIHRYLSLQKNFEFMCLIRIRKKEKNLL